MNKICTSIEQSKKLIELGIDVNTADMYYQYYKSYSPSEGITEGHCDIPVIGSWKKHHISIPDPAMPNADIPAWSLAALLELIPYEIVLDEDESLVLDIHKEDFQYYIEYGNTYSGEIDIDTLLYDDFIDAAFEMVVWLKENNKI